ncbi:hypothetical protein FCH28_34425 [Streptomyces piniterrae]|uniref:Uncharacterized protein n=1 Tax=Streptomyces piniterrae TaxID=2571125 RepID=A0A4U0MQ05_9ACTN|nr:hypothetical protein [Streptomyces piniterrae]TJZ42502.1 hypothetical protein FCH28_34425 [Streptomyces piniterrae]
MATYDPDLRKELDATLQTRKELGSEYESELVEAFLDKLDRDVDRRVRRQLAEQQIQVARGTHPQHRGGSGTGGGLGGDGFAARFGFATVSLVLAVPLSVIAAAHAGLTGLLVSWAGIVGVNAVHSSGFSRLMAARAARRDQEWG